MEDTETVSARQRIWVAAWALLLVLLYGSITWYANAMLASTRDTAAARHAARLDPLRAEPGKTPPDVLPETGSFAVVSVGTYIDRIENVSIKDSRWEADFYIWFRWKGDPKLDPGSSFQVVDGAIAEKELKEDFHGADGTNYQRYRVLASFTKFFDVSRFPLEDHMLNIGIEDASRDGSVLRYVVDEGASRISSRVKIPGYDIVRSGEVVKNHTYKSAFGDPRVAADARKIMTQYVLGISINRPGFGFYTKIVLALYAAIALALSVYFIKPADVDPRFGLSAGAFFGAVANIYLSNSLLPDAAGFGLIDVVNAVGLLTIFLTVAESVISLYLYDIREAPALSNLLDRTTFWVVMPCFILANVVIPWAAYLHA